MLVFDAHCDTLSKLVYDRLDFSSPELQVNKNNLNAGVRIFACFIKPEFKNPYNECKRMIERFYAEDFCFADSYDSIKFVVDSGRTASLLSIEGGDAIEGDVSKLEEFYRMGVRFMNLTWNYDNRIAGGVLGSGKGLTDFGKSVVSEMNRLGMVIDVSHLSDKSFFDVAEFSKKPFIASHSNSRTICSHVRNLTDEQFEVIKGAGGMIGINSYPSFLSEDKNAFLKDVILHIEHFLSLGGENCVGLGADFDGIDKGTIGLENSGKYGVLREELLRFNYSEELTDKILYKNFMIFVKNNL